MFLKRINFSICFFSILFNCQVFSKSIKKDNKNEDKFLKIQQGYIDKYSVVKLIYLNSMLEKNNKDLNNFILNPDVQTDHEKSTVQTELGYNIKLDENFPVSKIKIENLE